MTESDRKDMHRFVNRLRILRSIDSFELTKSAWDHPAVMKFLSQPYEICMRCSDERLADLYRVIRGRERNPIAEGSND